jgi:exonuclease VII large subunit
MGDADSGKAIRSVHDVSPGASLRAVLADGEILADITDISPRDNHAE